MGYIHSSSSEPVGGGYLPKFRVLLLLGAWGICCIFIAEYTIDRIPRGRAQYVCKEQRVLELKLDDVCGWQQNYGQPFKSAWAFSENREKLAYEYAKSVPVRSNVNYLLITLFPFVVYQIWKRLNRRR